MDAISQPTDSPCLLFSLRLPSVTHYALPRFLWTLQMSLPPLSPQSLVSREPFDTSSLPFSATHPAGAHFRYVIMNSVLSVYPDLGPGLGYACGTLQRLNEALEQGKELP